MSFGKAFFSSCLGALVAMIVFVFLVIVFFVSIASTVGSEEKTIVENNSVLHLNLDAPINELQKDDPFENLPIIGQSTPAIGLLQLIEAIDHAKADDNIEGIYLEVSYPQTGFSTLEEIRQSLIDFRKSGKWVIAYNEVMSEGAYYLASAADKIYLNPEGEIEFNGLTAEVSFFKNMLDKLEVKPQVFRVGEFKSAVEPFLYEKMSEPSRLQLTEMINSIYDHVLDEISESREIPRAKLEELSDKMEVRSAALAKEYKFVDDLFYKDEFDAELKHRLNLEKSDKIKFIRYGKYRKSYSAYKSSKNEIAVIVAEGAIIPGSNENTNNYIAADTFVEEIRKARENENVKAIVLRVNSPGGEFRSSDMIWREIQMAKKVKPVIASMSDYAASGGYYIAMGADTIVAQPQTITGSIGIFSVLFDMSGLLNNKLGITFDEVKTGEYGERFTVTRPLTDAEKNIWQRDIEQHYETFTRKASEGRDVSQDDIKKVASGRVWTGSQAIDRKLVDVLGGFNTAVDIAVHKAGVSEDYRLRYYPKPKAFFEQLMTQFEENSSDAKLSKLGELKIWYEQFKKVETYQGSQARMPFEIKIH
jgi:protease-4